MRVKYLYQVGGVLVMASVSVLLAARSAYHTDEAITRLLNAPTVIEQWEAGVFNPQAKRPTKEEPPLLKQAKRLAHFLNPPKPRPVPKLMTTTTTQEKQTAAAPPPVRPAQVSPSFMLLATSCYPANTAKSMALIEEPGRGRRWVRLGTRLGYLIVDKVDNGSIVYRDGETRYTMLRTTVEGPKPDSDKKPDRPSMTNPGEAYAHNGTTKAAKPESPLSAERTAIKRPSFQRLGPKR